MTDDYKRGLVTGLAMQPLVVVSTVTPSNIPLTKYEYISDTSVKFNDIIYTVEKDSTTGLISKISDSNGNEFSPTINSGITDITMHNAIFWAMAMSRGLTKQRFADFMPKMSDVYWYYDGRKVSNNTSWDNLIQGGAPIALVNASVANGIVSLSAGSYGLLDTGHSGDITIYVIAANTNLYNVWTQYAGMSNPNAESNGYELTIQSYGTSIGLCCTTGLWGSSTSTGNIYPDAKILNITNYHLIVLRRTGDVAEAFFDGVKATQTKACYTYSSKFAMGGYLRGGSFNNLNNAEINYKFIAIAARAQTDEEIITNSTWLMSKFGVAT